jgi:integrase
MSPPASKKVAAYVWRLCRMRHSRQTCAKLCHDAGGELEQIQFLLGHVSVQTIERYLGSKQRFRNAVNDHIGLDPGSS